MTDNAPKVWLKATRTPTLGVAVTATVQDGARSAKWTCKSSTGSIADDSVAAYDYAVRALADLDAALLRIKARQSDG